MGQRESATGNLALAAADGFDVQAWARHEAWRLLSAPRFPLTTRGVVPPLTGVYALFLVPPSPEYYQGAVGTGEWPVYVGSSRVPAPGHGRPRGEPVWPVRRGLRNRLLPLRWTLRRARDLSPARVAIAWLTGPPALAMVVEAAAIEAFEPVWNLALPGHATYGHRAKGANKPWHRLHWPEAGAPPAEVATLRELVATYTAAQTAAEPSLAAGALLSGPAGSITCARKQPIKGPSCSGLIQPALPGMPT